jgi:hypothetical protein
MIPARLDRIFRARQRLTVQFFFEKHGFFKIKNKGKSTLPMVGPKPVLRNEEQNHEQERSVA